MRQCHILYVDVAAVSKFVMHLFKKRTTTTHIANRMVANMSARIGVLLIAMPIFGESVFDCIHPYLIILTTSYYDTSDNIVRIMFWVHDLFVYA